jgi:hypothetical protein
MKAVRRCGPGLLVAVLTTMPHGPGIAQTNPFIQDLKRCLQDFDGIEFKLPYQPPLSIRSCATPGVNYDTGDKAPIGVRKMELIGELTLGEDADHLSSDERYAALQQALYMHFDWLFRQRGYRLTKTEQGNARTDHSAYTQCMLSRSGGRCVPDKPEPPQPPIPYVSSARYERQEGTQTVTLTYKAEMKNTWSITLQGVPDTPGAVR